MKRINTQGIVALIVIIVFLIVTTLLALYSYANGIRGVSEITSKHLTNYVSLFSGIIGTIVGYFFSRDDGEQVQSAKKQESHAKQINLQATIAILFISFFMIVSGALAFFSYKEDIEVITPDSGEPLKLYYNLFTATVGIIVGYFFGKEKKR